MKEKISPKEIEKLNKVFQRLSDNCKITIVVHVSPDGDAIGSALGLYHFLLITKNIKSTIIFPSRYPETFTFLSKIEDQIIAKETPDLAHDAVLCADYLFCLDFNEVSRTELVSKDILASKAFKILIDHHINPGDFADIIFSYPSASSTCLLLYKILAALNLSCQLTLAALEALYVGMLTDTGGFAYNSNDPDIYTTISSMLEKGLDKDKISAYLNRNYTLDKVKLNAHIIANNMDIHLEKKTAVCTLSLEEKLAFNYHIGDTEGLVNVPLEAREIMLSIFIYQQKDYVKLSFRSKNPFACNVLASKFFNGGGHRNAAGAEFHGSMKDAKAKVLEAIEQMHP